MSGRSCVAGRLKEKRRTSTCQLHVETFTSMSSIWPSIPFCFSLKICHDNTAVTTPNTITVATHSATKEAVVVVRYIYVCVCNQPLWHGLTPITQKLKKMAWRVSSASRSTVHSHICTWHRYLANAMNVWAYLTTQEFSFYFGELPLLYAWRSAGKFSRRHFYDGASIISILVVIMMLGQCMLPVIALTL